VADDVRTDIAEAAARVGLDPASKDLRKLVPHLLDGEEVRVLSPASLDDEPGILTLTDGRMFIFRPASTGPVQATAIKGIASIEWAAGPGGATGSGTLTVNVAGGEGRVTGVHNLAGDALVEELRVHFQ
jgi:hypothetical protein